MFPLKRNYIEPFIKLQIGISAARVPWRIPFPETMNFQYEETQQLIPNFPVGA
jgi:hypothetical protein